MRTVVNVTVGAQNPAMLATGAQAHGKVFARDDRALQPSGKPLKT